MQNKRRTILIALSVLYIGVIIWIIFLAYQRTTILNELRLKSDETSKSMYQLNNASFSLLYNSDDIYEAIEIWQKAYEQATISLKELSNHQGFKYIDSSTEGQLLESRSLWTPATLTFRNGINNLEKYLNKDLGLTEQDNIRNMLEVLNNVKEEKSKIGNKEEETILNVNYFFLSQSYTSLQIGTKNLWFYAINTIEKLLNAINDEISRVVRVILIITTATSFLLLLFFIIAIIVRQRILKNINTSLEKEVKERIRSIKNLLDYSGEGFLSFGPDLIINPEYSKECVEIFGEDIAGKNFAELLYKSKEEISTFSENISLAFLGESNNADIFEIIGKKHKVGDRIIQLDFHLVDESNLMCQFNDITENELLKRKIDKENTRREMVLRTVAFKHDFLDIKDEAKILFSEIEKNTMDGKYCAVENENDKVIRKVNTFKFNARFLKMMDTFYCAQELETSLIDYGILLGSEPLEPKIKKFVEAFNEESRFIEDSLGKTWMSVAGKTEIHIDKLENARQLLVKKHPEDEELKERIKLLTSIRLSNLFNRLSEVIGQLAYSNGKRVDVRFKCDDIFVSAELYKTLSDSASHILRNMITHGVEFPGHREKIGKSIKGLIVMSAVQDGKNIVLNFSDDGAGISVEKIKSKALKIGLVKKDDNLSDTEYVKLIFKPEFSTADTVTAISGRGYGLSAVKESIYEIGGKIKVISNAGKGTKFTIIVPNEITAVKTKK